MSAQAAVQKRKGDTVSGAEFGILTAHLAGKYGLTPAQRQAALGSVAGGRSRQQIEQAFIAWAKTLPKGA